jgi:hypothetical protein
MVLPLWMETYPWHGGTWMAYQDTAQKMRASSYTVIGNESPGVVYGRDDP